jgi:hypothetical protein
VLWLLGSEVTAEKGNGFKKVKLLQDRVMAAG